MLLSWLIVYSTG